MWRQHRVPVCESCVLPTSLFNFSHTLFVEKDLLKQSSTKEQDDDGVLLSYRSSSHMAAEGHHRLCSNQQPALFVVAHHYSRSTILPQQCEPAPFLPQERDRHCFFLWHCEGTAGSLCSHGIPTSCLGSTLRLDNWRRSIQHDRLGWVVKVTSVPLFCLWEHCTSSEPNTCSPTHTPFLY